MDRTGYVLVGGRSSRMGRDKALLPYRGGLLGASVARAVKEAAGSVTLVGNLDLTSVLGMPAIPDLYPGEGPLAGILAALAHTTAAWNLVVACDMPELSAELLRTLIEEAERCEPDALVPVAPSGRPEPLCAVYHRRCRPVIEGAFARGVRKVTEALADLRVLWREAPEAKPFQNVNTPEEWAAYASE